MRRTGLVAALACAVTMVCASTAAADTVIVKFVPGTSAAQQAATLGGATVLGTINGLGSQVVRVADGASAAARLNRSAFVQYAEVNRRMRAFAVPNDPRFGE